MPVSSGRGKRPYFVYENTIAGKAVLYISYKAADGSSEEYAWPYFIIDYALYAVEENWDKPCRIDDATFDRYLKVFDWINLWIEDIRTLSFTSLEELAKCLVEGKVESLLEEFEGDRTALAIGNRYTVTIFDLSNKIYEKTFICKP